VASDCRRITTLDAAAAVTAGARAAAFRYPILPGFDSYQAVTCLLPFRLLSPAAGMVAARWAELLIRSPGS
jgi:hypothetical protein